MGLLDYMKCMDSAEPNTALEQLAPDVHFVIALPDNQIRGTSRADFADYIGQRNASNRVHHVASHHRDGDIELVYGFVLENSVPTGAFLSAARIDAHGLIVRYQTSFETTLFVTSPPQA